MVLYVLAKFLEANLHVLAKFLRGDLHAWAKFLETNLHALAKFRCAVGANQKDVNARGRREWTEGR